MQRKLIIFLTLYFLVASANSANTAEQVDNQKPAISSLPKAVVPSNSIKHDDASKQGARLWNLQDADILSVINQVSLETGKNFVVDPRVSGKISLISSKPLRSAEVYDVFLSVLSLLGYSAIPSGKVIKIIPNLESGEQATRVGLNQYGGHGEEVVVRVIPLKYVSAAQLIPSLRPLLPQWSNIAAYTPGNILIILGRASNLTRLYQIIQEVDQASDNNVQVIPLKYATASQVALVINNLNSAARATGESTVVSIAVDERTNSILLGGPKAVRVKTRLLISQLDEPANSASGNTEVVYLRYLEAKSFAPLLGKIAQNILGKDSGGQTDTSPTPDVTTDISISSNQINPTIAAPTGTTSSKTTTTVISSSHIQAEPNSNAIIITAPPALMRDLKTVIAKLDVRPAQVLVEAIIAEVDEENLTTLGIQWGGVAKGQQDQVPAGGTAFSFPPIDSGVWGVIHSPHIRAILSMLQNQNGVNILSTPSVVVLDNQKATIEVGQDVPIQTGSYATSAQATTVTPFQTFGSKPVTLKLDVTPQINLDRSVRLKLDLKNDSLQNPQNPGLTPLINTSKISNSVIINSEDILVLGGLIINANNENLNKVPILSKVPVLGILFKQNSVNQKKRNLMVFIKPIIMKTAEDAMTFSYNKYMYTRQKQANFRDDLESIGEKPLKPYLPPWKNKKDLPEPFEAGSTA